MTIDRDALEIVLQTGGELFGKSVFDVRKIIPDIVWPEEDEPAQEDEFTTSDLDQLEGLLKGAAMRSMVGYEDKKIGFTLSGGVDSSLMLYLIKTVNPELNVTAYHTEWNYPQRSEQKFAKIVADFVDVPLKVIDGSPDAQAPFVEDAIIAHKQVDYGATSVYLTFKAMAEDSIDVAYNALGLDELFAGYTIHRRYYNRSAIRYLPFSKFLLRNKYYRGACRRWGSDKAWLLSDVSPRLSRRYVADSTVDFSEEYSRMKRKSLWNTIQHWTLDAMIHTFANVVSRMAEPHGLDVIYPYMDHDLMRKCLAYSQYDKANKAPIRRLMRERFGFPEEIPMRGERWDKYGWGATSIPYIESKKYTEAIMPSDDMSHDWFTPEGRKEYKTVNENPTVRTLNMAVFLKILEHQ